MHGLPFLPLEYRTRRGLVRAPAHSSRANQGSRSLCESDGPSPDTASGCGTPRAGAVGGGWRAGWAQGSNVVCIGCEHVLEIDINLASLLGISRTP